MSRLLGSGGISTNEQGQSTNEITPGELGPVKKLWGLSPFMATANIVIYNAQVQAFAWRLRNTGNENAVIGGMEITDDETFLPFLNSGNQLAPYMAVRGAGEGIDCLKAYSSMLIYLTQPGPFPKFPPFSCYDMELKTPQALNFPLFNVPAITGTENLTTGAIAYNAFSVPSVENNALGKGQTMVFLRESVIKTGEYAEVLFPTLGSFSFFSVTYRGGSLALDLIGAQGGA